MSGRFTRIVLFAFLCGLHFAATVNGDGLGASNESSICVQTEREIRALIINQDQAKNGVEGGVMVANDCKQLVAANVIGYRTDEEQKALCDNSCYATLNDKYKILLANDCFASNDTDEAASGNLQAVAYQLACQTTVAGKYCIPMLATLIADAGTDYDLCSDIIKDMGCCFQSYKQFMQYGTPTSITTLNSIQETCTKDGVSGLDTVCPCGPANLYNKYAFNGTKICSAALRPPQTTMMTMFMVGLSTMAVWLAA